VTRLPYVLELADQNAYSAFATRFRPHADRRFVEGSDGRTFCYADLARITGQMATLFVRAGVRKGDRVAALVEKSPEALMLWLAAARAGAVYLPVSTALREAEIAYIVRDATPRIAVCAPDHERTLGDLASECGIARVFTLDAIGGGSLRDAFEGCDGDFEPVRCSGQDAHALVYTSGTTGKPKGALIPHGLAVWNAVVLSERWGFAPEDVLLHANPPAFSIFGTSAPVIAAGASMILLPKFEPSAVVRTLPRATVFAGVPTYYSRLLETPTFTRDVCSNMRLFVTGSAPMRPDLFDAFRERTGYALLDRYGLTETLIVTSNAVDGDRRPGDSGSPLPGVELRIVDESGAEVSQHASGRIEVRQPFMFRAYWNAPDKSRAARTEDGFFVTGDLGRRDARGHVTVLGRGSELVITGGLNVYPKEVEDAINRFAGVKESAVIGVPHHDYGEAVVAVVQLEHDAARLDTADLTGHLRNQLAGYKVPKQIVVVPDMPRNALGKIQRNVLRQRYAELFGERRTEES
jgi:malonyl-CoA/methylmalonyl-CoA synthetase